VVRSSTGRINAAMSRARRRVWAHTECRSSSTRARTKTWSGVEDPRPENVPVDRGEHRSRLQFGDSFPSFHLVRILSIVPSAYAAVTACFTADWSSVSDLRIAMPIESG